MKRTSEKNLPGPSAPLPIAGGSDFRLYLQNSLLERCRKNEKYSLRAYARDLQVSPSALSAMLRGTRPITNQARQAMGLALGLSPQQLQRFASHSHGNKKIRAGTEATPAAPNYQQITADQFALISEWHHYALLELMKTRGFRWQSRWIGSRLGLTAAEVNATVERLVRAGMLQKKSDGGYEDHSGGFSTDLQPGLSSAAHRHFQQETLKKATQAVSTVPVELRDHTSMTMAINLADLPAARALIGKFRREMSALLEGNPQVHEVYQFSLALFPLTNPQN